MLINFKQRMRFDGSGGHVFFYIFVAIAVYNEVERERKRKKVNDDFYQYNTESVCNGLLTFQKKKNVSIFARVSIT